MNNYDKNIDYKSTQRLQTEQINTKEYIKKSV